MINLDNEKKFLIIIPIIIWLDIIIFPLIIMNFFNDIFKIIIIIINSVLFVIILPIINLFIARKVIIIENKKLLPIVSATVAFIPLFFSGIVALLGGFAP
jgi:hypothetical protein